MPRETASTAQYTKDLFQDSLLTGIPQIVQTRSLGRKILKSTILASCVIGFVYQTTEFMKIFWSYPTVLDIDVEYPEIIESPAITYCNLNGIKRNSFCEEYPDNCTSPQNITAFCNAFPDVCRKQGIENLKYPKDEAFKFEEIATIDDLKNLGHSSEDILIYCRKMHKDTHEFVECNIQDHIHMLMPDGNTGYRNCYILFSVIRSTTLKQHTLPVPKKKDALFHMVFEMEPGEYFRPDRQVGAIIAIHSPNTIINPFYDGFVIKPGNIYSVHLKVVEEKLLPFPYETQCKDYQSEWKKRNGKGPLSQEMCLAECVYNVSMKLCNCVIPNIMYYHEDRICSGSEMDCFDFNVSQCYTVCQQPCQSRRADLNEFFRDVLRFITVSFRDDGSAQWDQFT
ncbi:acid-sensing ion channel 5-like, partial [Stegodyphus dumicola]|uniref:acid-sensing ion channel 5-like n=1 Tax=Stegodyphus dumicola TaxID=202533 RepID=UPI0015B0D220